MTPSTAPSTPSSPSETTERLPWAPPTLTTIDLASKTKGEPSGSSYPDGGPIFNDYLS